MLHTTHTAPGRAHDAHALSDACTARGIIPSAPYDALAACRPRRADFSDPPVRRPKGAKMGVLDNDSILMAMRCCCMGPSVGCPRTDPSTWRCLRGLKVTAYAVCTGT